MIKFIIKKIIEIFYFLPTKKINIYCQKKWFHKVSMNILNEKVQFKHSFINLLLELDYFVILSSFIYTIFFSILVLTKIIDIGLFRETVLLCLCSYINLLENEKKLDNIDENIGNFKIEINLSNGEENFENIVNNEEFITNCYKHNIDYDFVVFSIYLQILNNLKHVFYNKKNINQKYNELINSKKFKYYKKYFTKEQRGTINNGVYDKNILFNSLQLPKFNSSKKI